MDIDTQKNIDHFFDTIITSYEDRIRNIQTAFQSSEKITESSNSLFDNVQISIQKLKNERELLNTQLCDMLAKNGSMRKKDYNSMMEGILNTLDKKQKEAENLFMAFVESQKETAQSLKNSLLGIKDISPEDTTQKIANVKDQLAQILHLQEIRKETVMKTFLDFQTLHKKVMDGLEVLLEKGCDIQVKDIKSIKRKIVSELN